MKSAPPAARAARRYSVNEIFFSLQGEGARAGTPNVFVRFSGCNLRCDLKAGKRSPGGFACDTEFESGQAMTAAQILTAARRLAPKSGTGVIFTGGEPALQLDRPLVDLLRKAGFGPLCIETNGTIDVAPLGLDWISLSPKVAEHAVRVKLCDEIRYVRGHGQGIPRPAAKAARKFISPAFAGDVLDSDTLRWCVDLVKANPDWALSVQQHKTWGIR
ncbi:MAG: 4Fe-4S cluster-binding domain-containing protein [Vicinamibacteria bacterium]|jgi:7-carboxy-7-deazaguanine synthase|nr:4Fe-4S cluster-binding domain-containing protein [Vicinamibacteria bacterium]